MKMKECMKAVLLALCIAIMAVCPAFADDTATGPALEIETGQALPAADSGAGQAQPAKAMVTPEGVNAEYVGSFKATAYCYDDMGTDMTASGRHAQVGHTVSADFSKFPIDTKLLINGTVYTVEDTGVYGNSVDIYMGSVRECLNWGVRYVDVYRLP